MAEQSYFVRIPDAELVKLALLETAKDSLLSSRTYHELLEIRKEKTTALNRLHTEAGEMVGLLEKLFVVLPQSEELLQEKSNNSSKKSTSKKKQTVKKSQTSAHKDSELDRLNKALSDIERKLENLS